MTTDAHLGYTRAAGESDGFSPHNAFSWNSPHVNLEQSPNQASYQQSPVDIADQISQQGSIPREGSPVQGFEVVHHVQPFEDVKEACLWRYFVEELSHWVSD